MVGSINDKMVDKIYAVAMDILLGLKRKDLADGLENMINLMVEKEDTNLTKVCEIIDVVRDGLPPESQVVSKEKKRAAGIMVFCPKTKRFLFPFRSDKVLDGQKWGVWGGHVELCDTFQYMDPDFAVDVVSSNIKIERYENFQKAAVRELEEETGLPTSSDNLEFLLHNSNSSFEYCVFLLKVKEEFEPDINWETDHTMWLRFEQFPSDSLSLGLRRIYESGKTMEVLKELSE